MKNKRVILYGAGRFFKTISQYYDLSPLNIIAIADKNFENHLQDETFLGYQICAPNEIKELAPDYVIVTTQFVGSIIENLEENILKSSKIKVIPMIKKTFIDLIKEFWN